jgi:hypothetical protein
LVDGDAPFSEFASVVVLSLLLQASGTAVTTTANNIQYTKLGIFFNMARSYPWTDRGTVTRVAAQVQTDVCRSSAVVRDS